MKFQPIRIAIVEPNGADVHWLRLSAKQARCAIDVVHYSTGVSALKAFTEGAECTPDGIVVAAVLPMLTVPEFIDAARTLHPAVPVAVVGEETGLPLEIVGVEWYSKPVSAHNIRQMCGYHTLSSDGLQPVTRERNYPSTTPTKPTSCTDIPWCNRMGGQVRITGVNVTSYSVRHT